MNQAEITSRFERLERLYGRVGVDRLLAARVVVFGVGGVGSFAAEALARSAIGHLLLVDRDVVSISNMNRQLQALDGNVDQSKARVLRDRLRLVNPEAQIDALQACYDEATSDELLRAPWSGPSFTFVVDCIDILSAKAHLLAACRARALPVVSSMGAGGKIDPTLIRSRDLADTNVCRLAHQLRKTLRQKHEFPRQGAMGVTAVYSEESPRLPTTTSAELALNAQAESQRHVVWGTAAFVTGAFGLACASHVVNHIVSTDHGGVEKAL